MHSYLNSVSAAIGRVTRGGVGGRASFATTVASAVALPASVSAVTASNTGASGGSDAATTSAHLTSSYYHGISTGFRIPGTTTTTASVASDSQGPVQGTGSSGWPVHSVAAAAAATTTKGMKDGARDDDIYGGIDLD